MHKCSECGTRDVARTPICPGCGVDFSRYPDLLVEDRSGQVVDVPEPPEEIGPRIPGRIPRLSVMVMAGASLVLLGAVGAMLLTGRPDSIQEMDGTDAIASDLQDAGAQVAGQPSDEAMRDGPTTDEGNHASAIERFVVEFLRAGETADPNRIVEFYGPEVSYYAMPRASAAEIRRDKENYFRVWTRVRSELASTVTTSIEESTGKTVAEFDVRFWANSGTQERISRGYARTTLEIREIGGRLAIVGERQRVTEREVLDFPEVLGDAARLISALAPPLSERNSLPAAVDFRRALPATAQTDPGCGFERAENTAERSLETTAEWRAVCELRDVRGELMVPGQAKVRIHLGGTPTTIRQVLVTADRPNLIQFPAELHPFATVVRCLSEARSTTHPSVLRLDLPGRRPIYVEDTWYSGGVGEGGKLWALLGDESDLPALPDYMTTECA